MRKATGFGHGNFARLKRQRGVGVFADFHESDLVWLEVALRLRIEACEENDEKREAAKWRRIHRKIAFVLEWK